MFKCPLLALVAAFFVVASTSVGADVVETRSGARLVGKVTAIDGSVVSLSTDYAGGLTIKQEEILRLTTDEPRVLRLAGGELVTGVVTTGADGRLQVAGETWEPGSDDPALAARAAKWSHEASVDVTGKSGNKEQSGIAVGTRSKRKGVTDTLQLYSAYNRQKSFDVVSSDQFKAGVDYANNFSGAKSWYVRDEGGFDRVKDIEFYNVTATGLGYDFIKEAKHVLTGRAGVGFRYEGYKDSSTEEVKSFGFDFGVHHEYTFGSAKLINDLTYIPAFNDFTIFRTIHESSLELPLAGVRWKLRLGVTNDYNSQTGENVEKLDTTYFTRFVLKWQ
jgi:putative salt-induced outer membrane protein YdiY